MAIDDPHGVVTLIGDGGVDQLLRRAIAQIEALGLEVFAVIDHSGDAAEAGFSLPDAKLVIFGSPRREAELMLAHPHIALDLPLKLLICEGGDGEVSLSYTAPRYLAHRYGLTDREADVLGVVETIAHATRSNPMTTTNTPTVFPAEASAVGDDPPGNRQAIVDGLSRLLADTYTLQLKTQNYHWNVTGPMFHTLHLLFGAQYGELALAVDLIAERIRALDAPAPASYREFARWSTIDQEEDRPDATAMIRRLVAAQDAVIRTAKSAFPAVEQAHDEPTADLLTQRVLAHEKSAWMLRSLLA